MRFNHKHTVNRHKYLTPVEVLELEELFKISRTKEIGNPKRWRNGIMLEVLLKTGMRQSELLGVRPMDLCEETQSIFVRPTKGSKERDLPISMALFKAVKKIANTRPPKDPIFEVKQRTLQGIWYEFRPKGCTKKLHSLRHNFSLDIYKRTKDILLLKRALGHRSIQSTMIYSEHLYEQEAFEKLLNMNGTI